MLPLLKKMSIENNKSKKTLGRFLADGELDATLGTSLPEEIRTNPDIVRLFPNYVEVDKDLWKRKGIYPIMHPSRSRRASTSAIRSWRRAFTTLS